MTLDEAIDHAEETANQRELDALAWKKAASSHHRDKEYYKKLACECRKCAEEHKQLAEWLKDYKRLLKCDNDKSKQKIADTLYRIANTPQQVYQGDNSAER